VIAEVSTGAAVGCWATGEAVAVLAAGGFPRTARNTATAMAAISSPPMTMMITMLLPFLAGGAMLRGAEIALAAGAARTGAPSGKRPIASTGALAAAGELGPAAARALRSMRPESSFVAVVVLRDAAAGAAAEVSELSENNTEFSSRFPD
jgi:hypothetical protein